MTEPEILRKGKEFHKLVQSDWKRTAEGNIQCEHTIDLLKRTKKTKHVRKGRMDLFVNEIGDYISLVEIKSTDWDKIPEKNIMRLVSRHRRQVWNYIEKYLDGDGVEVCAGMIYPTAPKREGVKERIESYLEDYGIPVVWYFDP